tara:strand:+ start:1238 stop:1972 length:735 start_codon:yes stop_codon:yes gene_type:complete
MTSEKELLLQKLAIHGILPSLAKSEAEYEFVQQFQSDDVAYVATDEEAILSLSEKFNLNEDSELSNWKNQHFLSNNETLFLDYAHYIAKRNFVINRLLSGTGESLFLKYKDRLDRVLYRLIRVEEEDLAHHLYYSIESNEKDFGSAAQEYSCGPESKTQGIIGPVDLTTPHPEIAARLRTANPGHIFKPFVADNWFVLVRLEYRFDSEYDDKTKEFLGGLLLGSKSNPLAKERIAIYAKNEQSI